MFSCFLYIRSILDGDGPCVLRIRREVGRGGLGNLFTVKYKFRGVIIRRFVFQGVDHNRSRNLFVVLTFCSQIKRADENIMIFLHLRQAPEIIDPCAGKVEDKIEITLFINRKRLLLKRCWQFIIRDCHYRLTEHIAVGGLIHFEDERI